jgi:glyoxalase family protein
MAYWMKRLEKFHISYQEPQKRFDDEIFIYFEDYDGLGLELVVHKNDPRHGFTKGPIPNDFAIRGFFGITLSEERFERTAGLLTEQMNHRLISERGNRFRFSTGIHGGFVDIVCASDDRHGLSGSGTIHHVAFAVPDDKVQLTVRQKLLSDGFNVTPVIDRQYFHSIYYHEPGGVLFEIATSDMGFFIDENPEHSGEELKLPAWEEKNRAKIEKLLPMLKLDLENFKD